MVNLKFAVGLLTLIGLVSIVATIMGGLYGEPVQTAIFTSPAFNSLMIIFTFALALALASRWPWKKTHSGWILTHIGLIVIVFGHMSTAKQGIEGHVDLFEGQSTASLEQKEWILTADVLRFGAQLTAVVPLDVEPDAPIVARRPTPLSRALAFIGLETLGEDAGPKVYTLPGGDTMTVEKLWPTYAVRTRVTPDFSPGAPPRPAVLLEVRAGKRTLTEWLFAENPEENQKALGNELRIVHRRFESAEALSAATTRAVAPDATGDRIVAVERTGEAAPKDGAHGTHAPSAGKVIAQVDIAAATGADALLGMTGYKVKVERRFERLAVVDGKPTERPDGPPNRALILFVTDPAGNKDRRFLFADHGEIGGAMQLPFELTFRTDAGSAPAVLPPGTLAVLEAPGVPPSVLLVEADGTERRSPFELGRPIALPWLGAEARFIDRYESAVSTPEAWCASYATSRPAVLVTVRPPVVAPVGAPRGMGAGGGAGDTPAKAPEGKQAWIVWNGEDRPVVIEGSQGPIELRMGPRRLPLGFTLQLSDFVLETYEGTENPKSFESFVRVTPHDGEAPFDYHIYMNHPLTYRGITFFQSSYDPETLQRSIFQVSKDPGWPIVYLGYALLTLGLAFVVYVKPGMIRREAERLAAEGLARAAEKKAAREAGKAPGAAPEADPAPDAPGSPATPGEAVAP